MNPVATKPPPRLWPVLTLICALACVEGESLAISAGAPATAAVRGIITDCGSPVSGAAVFLRVQQNEPQQARPVDVELGPFSTQRDGSYLVELSPSFAVPGPAQLELRVTGAGVNLQLMASTLEFALGTPPRDTARIDADLGTRR